MELEKVLFEKNYKTIKKVVLNAFEKSKYYHRIMETVGFDPHEDFTYEDYKKIPITDKNLYEANKFDMVTTDLTGFDIEYYNSLKTGYERKNYIAKWGISSLITSGSTGQPLEVIKGISDKQRDYYVLNKYRYKLTDFDFRGKFVWVWPVNPIIIDFFSDGTPETRDIKWESINDEGYIYSIYNHSQEEFEALYSFIKKEDITWITSSPTIAYKFAKYIKEKNLKVPDIKYIECHSEKLFDWQKEMITEVFKCDISSVYSSNEVQFIGCKCNCGKMHMFKDNIFAEFVKNDNDISEVLLTDLNYYDVPLIRYRLGDMGCWSEDQTCLCRLNGTPVFNLEGFRSNDYVIKPDNTVLEPFVISDSVYLLGNKFSLDIKRNRIEQLAVDHFIYYFDDYILKGNVKEYEAFLSDYLERLLMVDVKVEIRLYDDSLTYNCRKFKYFQNKVKLN